jgi:hypothetical protein
MATQSQQLFRSLAEGLSYNQLAFICSYSNGVPLPHQTIYHYKFGGNALNGPPQYAIDKLVEFRKLFPNV